MADQTPDSVVDCEKVDGLIARAQQAVDREAGRLRNVLMVPGCLGCQVGGARCDWHPNSLDVDPWPLLVEIIGLLRKWTGEFPDETETSDG